MHTLKELDRYLSNPRVQIWVISSIYWNTFVQSWIWSLSIESLATGSAYVTVLSQSRLDVTRHWKQRIMTSSSGAVRSSARAREPCRDRTATACCFIDVPIEGDPKVHGLRNECDDRVRYVKRRHLEVKYLRLQQLNYTEHLRIVKDQESEILSRKETKFRIARDAVRTDHLDIAQLTKLSCLGPRCGHTFQRSYWKGKSFCFLAVVSDSSPSATLGSRRIEACPASRVSKQRRERQTLVQ